MLKFNNFFTFVLVFLYSVFLFDFHHLHVFAQTSLCVSDYGGQCKDVAQCSSGQGLARSGLCPGASNIQCCMNFMLTNAAQNYDESNKPWQKAAAATFQSTLVKYPTLLQSFSCKYRGLTSTPSNLFCGAPIVLSNSFYYYSDSNVNHKTAYQQLQIAIESWTNTVDRNAWFTFVQNYRNLPAVSGGSSQPADPAPSSSTCSKSSASQWSIDDNGLNLITHFEGWYSCCYIDSVGVWTVGYGHACHVNNDPDASGNGCLGGNRCKGCISRVQGKALLKKDMSKFETCVRNAVKVPITQNQFSALVSFSFNVGCGALQESTLLKLLNSNQLTPSAAQLQFTRWHSGCLAGLMRRRFAEVELFNSCLQSSTFPCSPTSCDISYGYTKCAGTCSYCSNCISCSSSANAFQKDVSLSQAFLDANYSLPSSDISCTDAAYSGVACAQNENSIDGANTYKCQSTTESSFNDRSARTACDEIEDLPSNTDSLLLPLANNIEMCKETTPNVAKLTRVIRLESWQGDALSKITRSLRLPKNQFRIQFTIVKAPEGHQPTLVIRALTPTAKSSNITVLFRSDFFNQTSDADVSNDMSTLTIACANSDLDCSSPYTIIQDNAAISAAYPGSSFSPALHSLTSGVAAGLIAFSNSNPSRAISIATATAGLTALASLSVVDAQQAFCIAYINVTLILSPYDYSTTISAAQSGGLSFDSIDVFGSSKSGEIPSSALNAICLDPIVYSQFSVCSSQSVTNEITVRASQQPPLLLLSDLSKFYNPALNPHQKCALEFLQNSTQKSPYFQQFSCDFRSKVGSASNPYCGDIILLTNVLTVIQGQTNGSPTINQRDALKQFQVSLESSSAAIFQSFVRQWRNEQVCVNWLISRDGRCGASFGGAGCDPASNSPCCSPANWCGITADHCDCPTCVDYRKFWKTPITPTTPTVTATPKVTLSGRPCTTTYHPITGKPGVCFDATGCKNAGGVTATGLCPNDPSNVLCCSGDNIIPDYPKSTLQGDFLNLPLFTLEGNNGKIFTLVKIPSNHLTDPSIFYSSSTDRDNSINIDIANAWDKMRAAAAAAGVRILISSGFRTLSRQQYFWNCYKCGCCNGGSLAAVPGTSNHGNGIALDLNTNCGRQYGDTPPSECLSNSVYAWLRRNAKSYGFIRAVYSEPWHWEYRPTSNPPYFQ